ncbi:hypothetical protein [Neptunomonas japonica]|uniref:Phage tail protein n=1 Tax=Neptunomonas japonica JAMM 1380 TaxID=1441457 RepID=A0A7R6PFV3_9GAMM|nr:hypothetical protein [Neptunomonas japonica]BBB29377.1 conserved hypothetical protein [Neptunomonas japonica JAMM 1380]
MKKQSLKAKLLNPAKLTPLTVAIFGDTYQVARSSAAKVALVNNQLNDTDDPQVLEKISAQFILESIIDEDGVSLSESVTAEELLNTYDHVSVREAYTKIMKVNFGGSEGIEEAKKD